jgi:hypothetical protein
MSETSNELHKENVDNFLVVKRLLGSNGQETFSRHTLYSKVILKAKAKVSQSKINNLIG